MKIAMFLIDTKLKTIYPDAVRALIFDMENDSITGIEVDCLYNRDLDYILIWLYQKGVNIVYAGKVNDEVKECLGKIDISVRSFKELKNSELINALYLYAG